jgi:Pregnancy-associated plasma protein-A
MKIFSLVLVLSFSINVLAQPKAKIPVVFHVIYSTEEENIPDTLIQLELKSLQEDFSGENSDLSLVPNDFKMFIGNPNIEFSFADSIVSGSKVKSIVRVKTDEKNFTFRKPVFNKSKIWNPRKYLNVYIGVIRKGKTNGYVNSATPWTKPQRDAIALHYEEVGKGKRSLTHEIGHWFGLLHIFGEDNIRDTPGQKSPTGKECPKHNPVNNEHPVMFMNFMDYSPCRVMFTKEQVLLMHYNIENHRNELLTIKF